MNPVEPFPVSVSVPSVPKLNCAPFDAPTISVNVVTIPAVLPYLENVNKTGLFNATGDHVINAPVFSSSATRCFANVGLTVIVPLATRSHPLSPPQTSFAGGWRNSYQYRSSFLLSLSLSLHEQCMNIIRIPPLLPEHRCRSTRSASRPMPG